MKTLTEVRLLLSRLDTSSRLELTEEEAFALLSLCMMSESNLDPSSEKALQKLAGFCRDYLKQSSNNNISATREFTEAG
jgi:predicted DNA-binding transcriptional regulator YafY